MKRIVVFCGSSMGSNPAFEQGAKVLGSILAKQNIGLIYGGADIGLMGAVANGALESGGEVIGVLPKFLSSKEIAHHHLTELILVDSMHERKQKMNDLADGIIALPGGFGTLEELFEMLTWGQLGLHSKPIGVLNIDGFYDDLMSQLEKMVSAGFLKAINYDMILIDEDIDNLLFKMNNYVAPEVPKWITDETT